MPSIRERTTRHGERTFNVLWREGKRQRSSTWETRKAAEKFKGLLDAGYSEDEALALLQGLSDDRLTVVELAAAFLEWKGRPNGGVTARTLNDYRRDIANWITPTFGHRAAASIDEVDVQRWVDKMALTLTAKTVADRHMLLHSMFKFGCARTRRMVDHNPCTETELPKRKKKGKPLGTTTPEFRAILAAAQKRNPDAHDLILFLGETGWRFSEAIALAVRDVEDDGKDVHVSVSRVYRLDASGRQVIAEDEAKSGAAFRRIRPLPDATAMIRRRVVGKGPADLVFTNSRGRHWNQTTFLRETWPRIVADAQLGEDRRPTPHWLRHMHVYVMAAAGAPMHEIQRRVGHENYSTTVGVYGRMIGDVTDDTLGKAAAIMSGEQAAPSVAQVIQGEVIATEPLELEG